MSQGAQPGLEMRLCAERENLAQGRCLVRGQIWLYPSILPYPRLTHLHKAEYSMVSQNHAHTILACDRGPPRRFYQLQRKNTSFATYLLSGYLECVFRRASHINKSAYCYPRFSIILTELRASKFKKNCFDSSDTFPRFQNGSHRLSTSLFYAMRSALATSESCLSE